MDDGLFLTRDFDHSEMGGMRGYVFPMRPKSGLEFSVVERV